MNWLLPIYLIALVYVSLHQPARANHAGLRQAWFWFATVALSHFVFALIRASNFGDAHDLALTEIWADGIAWLLLGISFLFLGRGLAGGAPLGDHDAAPGTVSTARP